MKGKALGAAVAAMLAFGGAAAHAAVTLYVATTGTDDAACGTSTAPCKTVQYGIDKSDDGDTVNVASGTYNECVTIIPGTGVGGVIVVAASLVSSQIIGLSILDGAGVCDTASGTPGPVAVVYDKSVLSGFAVKNGGDSGVWGLGAVTITNNLISDNTTPSTGGGIFLATGTYLTDPDAKAQIRFNTIQDNTSDADGAGMYVSALGTGDVPSLVEIDGNTIKTNTAGAAAGALGGGLTVFTDTAAATDASRVVITTNVLDGNVAGDPTAASVSYGGGIFVATGGGSGLGTETIVVGERGTGNFVRNNVSHGIGGGVSANLQPAVGALHTITVAGNSVTANTGDLGGGGIHAFSLADNLATLAAGTNALTVEYNAIIGNHAVGDPTDPFTVGGGGVYAESYNYRTPDGVTALDIRRNAIRGNDASSSGGGARLRVFANDDPDVDGNTSPAVASVQFVNNLVATNSAIDASGGTGVGGGVSVLAQSVGAQASVRVEQTFLTVVGNLSDTGAGGLEWDATASPDSVSGPGSIAIELSNSILQGNDGFAVGGPILPGGTVSVSIDYNDAIDNVAGDYEAQLGASTGTNGNISVDPGLDALYVPLLCSATVDQGDPAIDPAAEPLPNGDRVNMGFLANTFDATRTFPDVNSDGTIDGLDILGVAVSFNTATGNARYFIQADRDLNGLVDGEDLAFVSAFYAQSCP